MEKPAPIPEGLQTFLNEALPNDGGEHTLALGEDHTKSDHKQWLKDHLSLLQQRYNLGTIGLELPGYMNVFLWAYKEGLLERELGSKQLAQDYMRCVLGVGTHAEYRSSQDATEDLIFAAMDAGIDVVSYDSRDTFESGTDYFLDDPDAKKRQRYAPIVAGRYDAPDRRSVLHNLLLKGDREYAEAWVLGEVMWLVQQNKIYEKRLSAVEDLVSLGHDKICEGRLMGDALNAMLFDALTTPGKNRISIGGADHICNIGAYYQSPIETFPGTFHHHIFAIHNHELPTKHRVTKAIFASIGDVAHYERASRNDILKNYALRNRHSVVADASMPLMVLETGERREQPSISDRSKYRVPLEKKFDVSKGLAEDKQIEDQQAHINPLLMHDMKDAYNQVKKTVHGKFAIRR